MLNCCTFFLVLTNLKGIIFVDVFILLHLVRFNSILSLCFQEWSSESCLSLLQNSPLVSILILKSLVYTGMSFLMVFSHHLVTSPVHSGWNPLTPPTMGLPFLMQWRTEVIMHFFWLTTMGKSQFCFSVAYKCLGTELKKKKKKRNTGQKSEYQLCLSWNRKTCIQNLDVTGVSLLFWFLFALLPSRRVIARNQWSLRSRIFLSGLHLHHI